MSRRTRRKLTSLCHKPQDALDLSCRLNGFFDRVQAHGRFLTLEAVCSTPVTQFIKYRGVGRRMIAELENALNDRGLTLPRE